MEPITGEKVSFKDRQEAGERLADRLIELAPGLSDPIVLGIPRGGIPVGSAVAQKLNCPLDVIALRKLPIPHNPEAGFGAVTRDRTVVLNEPMVAHLCLSKTEIDAIVDEVFAEVERRDNVFRKNAPFPALAGRSVIITDDGLATGYTMLAALRYCRTQNPGELFAAVPVCHEEAYALVRKEADSLITLHISRSPVFAVASYYEQFPEMSDAEVTFYL